MFLIGGRRSTRLVRSLEQGWTEYLHASHSTRGVEAFFKKTAIAYCGDPSKKAKLGWYAIAVFFKNASTPRVEGSSRKYNPYQKFQVLGGGWRLVMGWTDVRDVKAFHPA